MANFTPTAALTFAAEYDLAKVWGQSSGAPSGWANTDLDPGSPPPTDPGPCPDDPTANELQSWIRSRREWEHHDVKRAAVA